MTDYPPFLKEALQEPPLRKKEEQELFDQMHCAIKEYAIRMAVTPALRYITGRWKDKNRYVLGKGQDRVEYKDPKEMLLWQRLSTYFVIDTQNVMDKIKSHSVVALKQKLAPYATIVQNNIDTLVKRNLRLVASMATRYSGLDDLELFQEGTLGLLMAIEKYDHTRGMKFSTYAVQWVRQSISLAVASKTRTVRLPYGVHTRIMSYNNLCNKLRTALGREPEEEEIAIAMKVSIEQVREYNYFSKMPISTDKPLYASSATDRIVTIGDKLQAQTPTPEEKLIENSQPAQPRRNLLKLFSALSPRQRQVLRLHYGIGDNGGFRHDSGIGIAHPVEDIAHKLGISEESAKYQKDEVLRTLKRRFVLEPTNLEDLVCSAMNAQDLPDDDPRKYVMTIIYELTPAQQDTLRLLYEQWLDLATAAEVRNSTYQAVMNNKKYALKKIRKKLEEKGIIAA